MKLEGLEPVQILRSNRSAVTVSVFAFNLLDVSLVQHLVVVD